MFSFEKVRVDRNNDYFMEDGEMLYVIINDQETLYLIIQEEFKDELDEEPII